MVYELIPDDMTFMRLSSYGLPCVFDESHSDLRCSFFNSYWWDEEHVSRMEEAGGQTVDLKHTLQLALMQSDAEKLFRQIVDEYHRPEKEMQLAYEAWCSRGNKTKKRPVFFDDLSGLITTARLVAKSRNVSLAEASDFLERLLVDDGTVIYTKVAGQQVNELGEAQGAGASVKNQAGAIGRMGVTAQIKTITESKGHEGQHVAHIFCRFVRLVFVGDQWVDIGQAGGGGFGGHFVTFSRFLVWATSSDV